MVVFSLDSFSKNSEDFLADASNSSYFFLSAVSYTFASSSAAFTLAWDEVCSLDSSVW